MTPYQGLFASAAAYFFSKLLYMGTKRGVGATRAWMAVVRRERRAALVVVTVFEERGAVRFASMAWHCRRGGSSHAADKDEML